MLAAGVRLLALLFAASGCEWLKGEHVCERASCPDVADSGREICCAGSSDSDCAEDCVFRGGGVEFAIESRSQFAIRCTGSDDGDCGGEAVDVCEETQTDEGEGGCGRRIVCADGSCSPSCTSCTQGCCSSHGGC